MNKMLYGHIPGLDKPVARLVQGTLVAEPTPESQRFALMDAVFALGGTAFDTAHQYENGENERVVGRWVNQRGLREQVVIIGKGAHHTADRRRVTPFDIAADIADSLARFQFDYIDLYILHRDDPNVPVGPIVEALNEHQAAGRIRAFGGSNWSYERIEAANEYAAQHGLTPFAVTNPNFSLADQVVEPWENCISISGEQNRAVRAHYAARQMPVFAWSSLAGGFFSGRFRRDNLDTFTGYLDTLCVKSYCYEDNFKRLDRVMQLAAEMGLTVPQVAMAYVFSQPMNMFALVGCQTGAQFEQNIQAMMLKLPPEIVEWLELRRDTR